ncbi:ATP-binding cassette domain-containing protein [Cocleimonas sp. KMM 6892]|uniref:ATP-binding cassette domain-containing protein n=1 Tax=unclassified Cocleimonas TaxID=2639732 RepID=UPI002DC0647A|nr:MULTISPECIES: ATP-binding cassette domain-containing protein [unclassified Cocleimonas]MEB8431982.1 ATP-binding cassette domain-containing protein [Cocleimonas sp. KMM 6892]MEC4714932.1 ATP-binding cassette domain-containing protein [Cocleimonas sp. KMM 6895]MEC4744254.1 ATP-binding cassette domain-containing protein [Cocleimonas sp. KMM 6896]
MSLFDLQDVSISYDETVVLANLNLTIHAGERIALLGKSGSGKSTLLRYLYELSSAQKTHKPTNQCAWAPQAPALSQSLSVYHNVYMGRLNEYPTWRNLWNLIRPFENNVTEIKQLLDVLRLKDECFNKVNTLSGGQQQRTGLARALYQEKPVLLADEPVSAVDEYQAEEIIKCLQSYSQTIILGLHDSYLALNHCDRIIGLKDGKVLVDSPSSQLNMADLACLYQ